MKQKLIYIALIMLPFLAFLFGANYKAFDFGRGKGNKEESSVVGDVQAKAGTKDKFDYLAQQRSSTCGLQAVAVEGYSDSQAIQGSCCSAMDLHRYQEQVEGLKQYSQLSVVPQDPYDIPAPLAKELFAYQKEITLTSEQQKVYDQAMKLSHEGGPCCCRCWRWTAFEGQAKYLITRENWTSEQIAELWDMEDGCGGAGHIDGMHS